MWSCHGLTSRLYLYIFIKVNCLLPTFKCPFYNLQSLYEKGQNEMLGIASLRIQPTLFFGLTEEIYSRRDN